MRNAQVAMVGGTAGEVDDMASNDTDPDLLTIGLVRKVMDQPDQTSGLAGGKLPTRRTTFRTASTNSKDRTDPEKETTDKNRSVVARFAGWVLSPVLNFQPTRLHMRTVTIMLIIVVSPLVLPVLLGVTLFLVGVTYFTVGPDRIVEIAVAGHDRIALRNPKLAALLRGFWKSQVVVFKGWSRFLPERWTEDLFAQEFKPSEKMQDKVQADPLDRLAAEERNNNKEEFRQRPSTL